ncbi:BRAP2 RING ZnF UBP domain-containing protein 2 [Camellia lanceoleosa]|nr:BRAP2 RING ZnF UBP domain-containing protein 2 [Camellia lanceoleosa]
MYTKSEGQGMQDQQAKLLHFLRLPFNMSWLDAYPFFGKVQLAIQISWLGFNHHLIELNLEGWNMKDLFLPILIWDDKRFVEFHRFQHMMCPILEYKTKNTINACVGSQNLVFEDYVRDNCVHHLIQSKTDGKLVDLNHYCAHADDGCGSCNCSIDTGFSETLEW